MHPYRDDAGHVAGRPAPLMPDDQDTGEQHPTGEASGVDRIETMNRGSGACGPGNPSKMASRAVTSSWSQPRAMDARAASIRPSTKSWTEIKLSLWTQHWDSASAANLRIRCLDCITVSDMALYPWGQHSDDDDDPC